MERAEQRDPRQCLSRLLQQFLPAEDRIVTAEQAVRCLSRGAHQALAVPAQPQAGRELGEPGPDGVPALPQRHQAAVRIEPGDARRDDGLHALVRRVLVGIAVDRLHEVARRVAPDPVVRVFESARGRGRAGAVSVVV